MSQIDIDSTNLLTSLKSEFMEKLENVENIGVNLFTEAFDCKNNLIQAYVAEERNVSKWTHPFNDRVLF